MCLLSLHFTLLMIRLIHRVITLIVDYTNVTVKISSFFQRYLYVFVYRGRACVAEAVCCKSTSKLARWLSIVTMKWKWYIEWRGAKLKAKASKASNKIEIIKAKEWRMHQNGERERESGRGGCIKLCTVLYLICLSKLPAVWKKKEKKGRRKE